MALAWLTISTPFVYAAQQQQKALAEQFQLPDAPEEDYNPFAGTNEEKTEGGSSTLSEEYLHNAHHIVHHGTTIVKYYKCHPADLYVDYHPESFSPPPEA